MIDKVNEQLNNSTGINNTHLGQATGVDSAAMLAKKNPYSNIDKNLLIDELDISDKAMNLYQKDIDIKKFSDLALSDPQDNSHNKIVASQIENGIIELTDEQIAEELISSKLFMDDLVG